MNDLRTRGFISFALIVCTLILALVITMKVYQ